MISTAYSYYLSQYGRRSNVKYDSHTRTQLKDSYSRLLKTNSLAPACKIDVSLEAQKYAIDLKEHARALGYIVRDLSNEAEDQMTFKKSAVSTNPDAVSVEYVGDSNSPDATAFDIEVSRLASNQINIGNYLQPSGKLIPAGSYTFDLDINNLTYQFEFDVSSEETSLDIQNKISRLINRSNIGLSSEILTDQLGNTAISIESDATGVKNIRPTIFNINSEDKELTDTLGLNRVNKYPVNALFSINGEEQFSMTNEFVINKAFCVTLSGLTNDSPATISLQNDSQSIVNSIDELLYGYNSIMSIANDSDNNVFSGNERLRREFSSIAKKHQITLNNNGFNINDNGEVSIDKDTIISAANDGSISDIFSELNDFRKAMKKKADDIYINPMNYVNNKIIAYKNPLRPVSDPYNLSAYTGMMFNGYI